MIPCGTEIVCALGLEQTLIGRSHECDFPASVRRLPVCTQPNFNAAGTSHEINDQVQDVLQAALSVYLVQIDKLAELQPDVIITQAQCEVCAVSLDEVERAIGEALASRPHIISLQPNRLSDVWDDIVRVANGLRAQQRANELIARLKMRIEAVAAKARILSSRPKVACIEWIDPLMAAGNWVPEIITLAGGQTLFGAPGEHSPWLSWEDLCSHDPDVIVVMPCGFDTSRSRRDMPLLTRRLEWPHLRAVQNRQVYLTDGSQYFNRPGPRLVESLEIAAEIMHPQTFQFRYQGTGWQRL